MKVTTGRVEGRNYICSHSWEKKIIFAKHLISSRFIFNIISFSLHGIPCGWRGIFFHYLDETECWSDGCYKDRLLFLYLKPCPSFWFLHPSTFHSSTKPPISPVVSTTFCFVSISISTFYIEKSYKTQDRVRKTGAHNLPTLALLTSIYPWFWKKER